MRARRWRGARVSETERLVSQLRFFWAAMSLIGYSTRQDDIDDVTAFVASFGDRGYRKFRCELQSFHNICATSGLSAHMAQVLADRLGRRPSDSEVRASVEELATSGRSYLASCIDDPGMIGSKNVEALDSSLEDSLRKRSESTLETGSVERLLTMVAPLRRDGQPWVGARRGLGVGLRWDHDWPFRTLHFGSRIDKMAAMCSQSADWIDLRRRGRFRYLDVTVEWWPDLTWVDAAWVKRRSSTTLEVFIPRLNPASDLAEDGDGVSVGDGEASFVMGAAWDLVVGHVQV
jgi:hypothetical protein